MTKLDVAVVDTLYPECKGYCMDCLISDVRDVEPFLKYFFAHFSSVFYSDFLDRRIAVSFSCWTSPPNNILFQRFDCKR